MDMLLPLMAGLAATEYIMAHCLTPIPVVSSTNRGELFKTYDALAAGAVDVLEKPSGNEPEGQWEQRFIATLKRVARIRVIARLHGRHHTRTPRRVSYARDGEPVAAAAGRVVMAPPDRHLVLRSGRLLLTHDLERHTGMGRDGAAGLLELRRAGGITMALDEATSEVYGMLREAALLGAAAHMPLADIGPALAALATPQRTVPS